MGQLHELIAVEKSIQEQWTKINEETSKVFAKPQMFVGKVTRLEMTKPGLDEHTKQAMEAAGSSVEALATTVNDRLDYTADFFISVLNHRLQKDLTNQKAKADIVIGSGTNQKVLAQNVPATFLLELETRLTAYRSIYAAVPTLDVKKDWVADPQTGDDVFKVEHPEVRTKTEKDFRYRELVKATDKHPAQIEKWMEDVTVGKITVTEKSGMWTSKRKADVLARCDELIVAVKTARARANQTQTEDGFDVGSALVDFMEAEEVKAGS